MGDKYNGFDSVPNLSPKTKNLNKKLSIIEGVVYFHSHLVSSMKIFANE